MTKVKSKNEFIINGALNELIKKHHLKVKSITIDNGIEFAKIGILGAQIGCKICLCKPYTFIKENQMNMLMVLLEDFEKKKLILVF